MEVLMKYSLFTSLEPPILRIFRPLSFFLLSLYYGHANRRYT